ncbi:MAG TPA: hypothetical protein VM345_06400 [Acidimicrobiales bacterium]|nr:hypothetical protein [Acidimicrobiales bacterium]
MVAFLASLIATAAMTGAIVWVGKRRKPGTPLTWGEAFVAGAWLFFLMFLIYGIVPHQFLTLADNDLAWRSDKIGIPIGPIGKAFGDTENRIFSAEGNVLFPEGVPLPNGTFVITAQVLRDIIASGIYIVFLVAQIVMWLQWQKRGQKAAEKPELTSAYGRPLVRGAS